MDLLIPVINKLQDCVVNAIGAEAIELPTIVVLGSQSSGKSSLVESIVGKSFLPRGAGIVTRRPLILQLVYCAPENNKDLRSAKNGMLDVDDWGIFLHKKNKTFKNFDKIREEIEKETNRMAGANKGICPEPITLKIFSKSVVDLTIIDLPGLTAVPVGDQPEDIGDQIRSLALKFISNPNSIILTIMAANVDMATNESLKLAREVDPDGERTLAVITKLDLMDQGTDAVDVLSGKVIPVKLGIIGVVNRSQQDIIDKKSIQEALKSEAAFLKRRYPMQANKNGTPYLAKTLNRLLMHHINDCLPDLKKRINDMISELKVLHKSYGENVKDKNQTLLQLLTKFSNSYCSTIEGTAKITNCTKLFGGSRIHHIFHETFGKILDSINPLKNLDRWDIFMTIKNTTGLQPEPFVVHLNSFEVLVKRQIRLLEEPSQQCVELVYEVMQQIIHQCGTEIKQDMARFPKLFERIVDVVTQLLNTRLLMTNEMVENVVKKELAYINTEHQDIVKDISNVTELMEKAKNHLRFIGLLSSKSMTRLDKNNGFPRNTLSPPKAKRPRSSQQKLVDLLSQEPVPNSHKFSQKELLDITVMEMLIESYFNIVKKSIQDSVPKFIMLYLVNHVKENLYFELIGKLYNCHETENLLTESEDVAIRRKETEGKLKVLTQAGQIINEIRETHILS